MQKGNRVYVGIVAESYWRNQEGIDLEIVRNLPISPGTYVSCVNGYFYMNYSHDANTFLGAMEVIHNTLGEMVVTSFPKRHPFRKMDKQGDIDEFMKKILIQRFGKDIVRV